MQSVNQFSPEQQQAIDLIDKGESVLILGKAGTGKSYCLKEIRKKLPARSTFVTALSGLAANNIDGITLHAFAGIGLGNGTKEDLFKNIAKSKKKILNWIRCKALIVDEISMCSAQLFEKLDYIARHTRHRLKEPFGGIQLILFGDFAQLPPVFNDIDTLNQLYQKDDQRLLFESEIFYECIQHTIELKKVFRQKEPEFLELLEDVRNRKLSEKSYQILDVLKSDLEFDDANDIKPVILEALNADVDAENQKGLDAIQDQPIHTFMAEDQGNDMWLDSLKKKCIAPECLELKIGAQVILLRNDDGNNSSGKPRWVNGSQGIVVGFKETIINDKELLSHSKGTLTTNINSNNNNINYPMVRLLNGCIYTIKPSCWSLEDCNGCVLASRVQVPLRLAYALTIHKAQGMTIERLIVNLTNVFTAGQTYVALSRATSLNGLQVIGFDESKIICDPKVQAFYKNGCQGKKRKSDSLDDLNDNSNKKQKR